MRTPAFLVFQGLLLASGCNPADPCAKYDIGICERKAECEVFLAAAMGNTAGSWCRLPSAISEGEVCMSAATTECDHQTNYAGPPDDEGNASDECFSYNGCSPPQGWVDCDPAVGLTVIECDP
ncbi:MAG: hypothetical protein EXR69_09070 [Myxococcales bacterium]|nr:hypothetical protein [Myxococcales bacterium]